MSEVNWDEAGKLNAAFFDQGCERHGGEGWKASHFLSQDSQWGVYHALMSRLPINNVTLLDVGCGQGDLIPFIYQNKKKVTQYHGIDVSAKMVDFAVKKYGPEMFTHGNFLDPERSFEYDVVVAAGPYNYRVHENYHQQFDYLRSAVTKMYKSCRRACAFTLLSSHGYEIAKDWNELVCYEPWEVMEFCMQLTTAVVVDHASIPAEFTVSLFRDDME